MKCSHLAAVLCAAGDLRAGLLAQHAAARLAEDVRDEEGRRGGEAVAAHVRREQVEIVLRHPAIADAVVDAGAGDGAGEDAVGGEKGSGLDGIENGDVLGGDDVVRRCDAAGERVAQADAPFRDRGFRRGGAGERGDGAAAELDSALGDLDLAGETQLLESGAAVLGKGHGAGDLDGVRSDVGEHRNAVDFLSCDEIREDGRLGIGGAVERRVEVLAPFEAERVGRAEAEGR